MQIDKLSKIVNLDSINPFGGNLGQAYSLPLIPIKRDGRFGANLGIKKGWKMALKSVTKSVARSVTRSVAIFCEQTINSVCAPRGCNEFVFACHAGSCEFESRPSRKNPQTLYSGGFLLPKPPRQTYRRLSDPKTNKKQGTIAYKKCVLPAKLATSVAKIGNSFHNWRTQNEEQINNQKYL